MTADRRAQIADLFLRHGATVRGLVAAHVSDAPGIVDDACQSAWERLCTHTEVDLTRTGVIRWLVVTATREAWRRARLREVPVGGWLAEPDERELPEPAGPTSDPFELVLARERYVECVGLLAKLTARERRFLGLHAIGLNYREIADVDDASLRTVERQILRACGKLGLVRPRSHSGRKPTGAKS